VGEVERAFAKTMVPFTGDRGFESLFIEGAVPPKLSALAALASSIRETLAGFAGFVRPHPGASMPYICRMMPVSSARLFRNALILLASPTGFEPVLPP
jgi:hypothetical protein